MGTHPSGPSTLAEGPFSGEQLLAFIRDHPEVLGKASASFGVDLPFLFKVLSVRTALSIQSHPDKDLASRLHVERPTVYKDGNHKPEMAIALSGFEALCGFCPHEELIEALESVSELRDSCGEKLAAAYIASSQESRGEALQAVFTSLMTADKENVRQHVESMVERLRKTRSLTAKEELVLRLHEQYPGDVGVLAAWFLNFVKLETGQAIALAANEPHAYVSGEIIECMATSDNVIRAGLTPKLRDTDVLCASLTYKQEPPTIMLGEVDAVRHLTVYRPPFEEFEVWKFAAQSRTNVSLPPAEGPMLLLVLRGKAVVRYTESGGPERTIHRGQVFFVGAGTALNIFVEEDMVAWSAAANGMGF